MWRMYVLLICLVVAWWAWPATPTARHDDDDDVSGWGTG